MVIYVENLMEFIIQEKILEPISEFSKVSEYQINMQISGIFLHANK